MIGQVQAAAELTSQAIAGGALAPCTDGCEAAPGRFKPEHCFLCDGHHPGADSTNPANHEVWSRILDGEVAAKAARSGAVVSVTGLLPLEGVVAVDRYAALLEKHGPVLDRLIEANLADPVARQRVMALGMAEVVLVEDQPVYVHPRRGTLAPGQIDGRSEPRRDPAVLWNSREVQSRSDEIRLNPDGKRMTAAEIARADQARAEIAARRAEEKALGLPPMGPPAFDVDETLDRDAEEAQLAANRPGGVAAYERSKRGRRSAYQELVGDAGAYLPAGATPRHPASSPDGASASSEQALESAAAGDGAGAATGQRTSATDQRTSATSHQQTAGAHAALGPSSAVSSPRSAKRSSGRGARLSRR